MGTYTLSFDEMTGWQNPLAGGKGSSLARLYQAGFPVPPGFVILPAAFDEKGILPQAWEETRQRIVTLQTNNPDIAFAVRSSALGEDSTSASFAGEFETLLNVRGDEEILKAIDTVYRSRESERVRIYRQARGEKTGSEIAVIIQELVEAEKSGVLFTSNPVTQQRDEIVLTAAWGLGEAIVGGLVTPDTITVQKTTGRILRQDTADKQVMTVLQNHGTAEQPVPEAMRHSQVLNKDEVKELVRLGVQVEVLYGMPMDIEWVIAQQKIRLVQARPITTLPTAGTPALAAWKLPKGQYAALRNNIVELMPNPLTPLFDTLGREAINASLNNLAGYFLGKPGIMPEEIVISVNGYAYNNGSVRALKLLGILLGTGGILKRMFRGAVERWTGEGRPRYIKAIENLQDLELDQCPSTDLLLSASELYRAAIDAYGALVSGVIPAAWMSEALFTRFYNAFIKRDGNPSAQTFLLGFDNIPIRAEKSLYDLAGWARHNASLAAYLSKASPADIAVQMACESTPAGVEISAWNDWKERCTEHLQQYGHMIYDLDFATPVPADDPTPLLETCQMYLLGEGSNPYTRQRAAENRRIQAQAVLETRLKGWRLKYFRKYLLLAQRFAPLREDGLADVGLGYPLLRKILRELGRRFAQEGLIQNQEDIFWLTKADAAQAAARCDAGEETASLIDNVAHRKAAWQAARRVTPPLMLPQMKLFGVDLAEVKSGRARKQKGSLIQGAAASPGVITAPACVLHGVEEFSMMKPHCVLVASITTPAWTPLFARAAGVVTDIGGPLSHGSIVAREYGIPAVLGTGVATQLIHSGQMITVDGNRGTVQLQPLDN